MANTENIEAKLAAYVEGELDVGERAEIEKHLAGNPQHQALLEELTKMRFVVRDLPRESAPPEILERVQQQIERSVLLGDTASAAEPMRLNRWPSLLIAASIGFLAVGLGVVVYFALPGKAPPSVLALKNESAKPAPTAAPGKAPGLADSVASAEKPAPAPDVRFGLMAGQPLADGEVGKKKDSDAKGVPDMLAKGQVFEQALLASNAFPGDGPRPTTAPDAFFSDREQMVLVVDSANPAVTQAELSHYLNGNKLTWQVDTEPMPEAVNFADQKEVAASRAKQVTVQLKQMQPDEAKDKAGQTNVTAGMTQRYLVRNVSRAQINELNGVLEKSGARPQSQYLAGRGGGDRQLSLKEDSRKGIAPGDAPANQPATTQPTVQNGEFLSVTVDQLVGPGVEKTNTVRVNEEGTIALPMVEPIRVAGLDETQVKTKIAEAYRETQLIQNPTVSLAKVDPTTQPATQPVDQAVVLTTQPAQMGRQDLARQSLATPASPTTAPADQVDVVIVLQSAPVAEPEKRAAEPATLPTTAPAPNAVENAK